jgi:hypothetical protein
MSFLLAAVKPVGLAAALLVLSAIGPGLPRAGADRHAELSASTSPSATPLRCRLYFGRTPAAWDRSSDVRQ